MLHVSEPFANFSRNSDAMFVTESQKTAYPQTVLASANLCLRLLQARLAFTEFRFLSQRACKADEMSATKAYMRNASAAPAS